MAFCVKISKSNLENDALGRRRGLLAWEVEGDCDLEGRGLEAGAGRAKAIHKFKFSSRTLSGIEFSATCVITFSSLATKIS